MTDRAVRDIQHEKGAPFTIKFIQWFDKEWTGVVLAAQKIRERNDRSGGKGKMA